MRKYTYYIAATAAIIFWSMSFIGTKLAYVSFGPLTVCFLRFLIAWVILFCIRQGQKEKQKLEKKDFGIFLASALVGISVYYALENIALSLTSASNASLISGAYPVITLLVGMIFFHLKLDKWKVTGIIMAVIGVFILTGGGSMEGKNVHLGNAIVVANGFLWAFYNFLIPHIDRHYSTLTITYYQTLLGIPFLIPGMLYEKPDFIHAGGSAWAAVLFLAVICSVAAYLLYNFGLRGISTAAAASIMNLMPVFGLVFSALILHEAITMRHIIGGAIVILGVIFSAR